MKRAPRSLQHHVLYRKYNGQDSDISALLGKCGFKLAYLNEFNRMEEELRKQAQFSIPQDYASALRLAADEHEKRIALEAKVAEDAPNLHPSILRNGKSRTRQRLPEFGRLNFQETSYTDGFNREQRAIDMTRDPQVRGIHQGRREGYI